MILDSITPIRLDYLSSAWLSFIELSYLEAESIFEPKNAETLEEAIQSFINHLSDYEDREAEIRKAMCWVLNLPPEKFEDVVYKLKIPFPRFDRDEIHRYLELLWERAFSNWKVKEFDLDEYEIQWQDEAV